MLWATRPHKIDGSLREVGEPVPEGYGWPNLASYLRTGDLVEAEHCPPHLEAVAKARRDAEAQADAVRAGVVPVAASEPDSTPLDTDNATAPAVSGGVGAILADDGASEPQEPASATISEPEPKATPSRRTRRTRRKGVR